MDNLNKEIFIIDYLYGEVDEDRKIEIEKVFEKYPEWRQEAEELKGFRQVLMEYEDEKVPVENKPPAPKLPATLSRLLSARLLAIAASICLLMLMGALTHLNLQIGSDGFALNFGDQDPIPTTIDAHLSKEQVRDIFQEQLVAFEQRSNNRLSGFEEDIKTDFSQKQQEIESSLTKYIRQTDGSSADATLENQLAAVKTENSQELEAMFETYSQQQNAQLNRLLSSFFASIEAQRENDLMLMQQAFNQILTAVDSKEGVQGELNREPVVERE